MKNEIRNLRENMGLTQEELAKLLLVSRQTIISLEKGHYDPSIRLAFKIAKLFGKPVESVFNDEEE
ncbi:MAG: helix-turn-helix transcriptional regulator [Brevinematales bacterium]